MGQAVVTDHANSGSLVAAAFIMADNSKEFMGPGTVSRDLGEAFAMMGLPVPAPGEFFQGQNADRVFLNTHNIVISVVYRREPGLLDRVGALFQRKKPSVFDACEIVRPDILQPIYSKPLGQNGNCRLEIIPGVERVGVAEEKAAEMASRLKKAGIEFYNPKPEYVGILRTPGTEQSPLLVVNRRAIRPTSKFHQDGNNVSAGIQDRIFGPLHSAFEDAFKTASGAEVCRVMNECARIARLDDADPAKILRRHWMLSAVATPRAIEIKAAARHYQEHLVAA